MSVDFTTITACGENCSGCKKRESGLCQGCRASDGRCTEWRESGECPIHRCAREHGALFCGLCEDFPCGRLAATVVWRERAVQELTVLAEEYRRQHR